MTTICIDISGSAPVGQYLNHIAETEYPFRLVAFDHCVRQMSVIHEKTDLKEFLGFMRYMGGGTDYSSLFSMLERDGDTEQCIVYSDGYGYFPKKRPSFPVYWVADFLDCLHPSPPIGEILP